MIRNHSNTSSCIVSGNIEEFDKFNSAWENAMVLYYDEPGEKELQLAKLKKATGEKDMRLEKKGQDSVQTDRNFSFLFLSNNPKGVVQLSGGSASAEDASTSKRSSSAGPSRFHKASTIKEPRLNGT